MQFLDPEDALRQFGLYGAVDAADIGSGAGHFSLAAARRLEGGRLFAVDVEKDMLARLVSEARERGLDNVHPIWGDAATHAGVPLSDASLDRAIVANTLFAVHDRDGLVREVRRMIKPGGKVLVVDWVEDVAGGPHPHHRVTPDTVLGLFRKHGFEKTGDIDAGSHHYGMIFSVPN